MQTCRLMWCGLLLVLTMLEAGCSSFKDAKIVPGMRGDVDTVLRGSPGVPGTPTIVLMHGLGTDMQTFTPVLDRLAHIAPTFAFNRPGYGNSAYTSHTRDAMNITDEARATLQAAGVKPPYVLVGHSLGGVYAQVYARRFPGEVAGMVLIDTTVPGQEKMLREFEPAGYAFVSLAMATGDATQRAEFHDAGKAEDQIQDFPAYRGGKVKMLVAMKDDLMTSAKYANARRAAMRTLAQEYGAEVVEVQAGHFIHKDAPDAVIAAVAGVLGR